MTKFFKSFPQFVTIFFQEVSHVLKKYDSWLYLGWVDIKLRYRRTVIGPMWMVIVSFVTIVCIALLGSLLFKAKVGDLFPYVACGMTTWTFLSTLISDSCMVFLMQLGLIKNVNIHILSFCFRLFVRSAIMYAHNLIVVFLILLYFKVNFSLFFLICPISFAIYMLNSVCLCVNLGFLSTRYRDVIHMVQAMMGILAFLTPIMWKPEYLGSYAFIADFNPFTHFIAIIREPLLGHFPPDLSWMVVSIISLINLSFAISVYGKYRKQVIYWL